MTSAVTDILSAEVTVVVEFEAARSVVEAARPSGD